MSMPEGCVCSPPPDTDGPLPWCPVHGNPEVYRVGKIDSRTELVERLRLLDRWGVPPGLVGGDDSDTYPVPVVRWSALQEVIGEPL